MEHPKFDRLGHCKEILQNLGYEVLGAIEDTDGAALNFKRPSGVEYILAVSHPQGPDEAVIELQNVVTDWEPVFPSPPSV